jgi:hypothetical protein
MQGTPDVHCGEISDALSLCVLCNVYGAVLSFTPSLSLTPLQIGDILYVSRGRNGATEQRGRCVFIPCICPQLPLSLPASLSPLPRLLVLSSSHVSFSLPTLFVSCSLHVFPPRGQWCFCGSCRGLPKGGCRRRA